MIRLLLVDDDPIVLEMMSCMVDYPAFGIDNVETAGSLREAITVLEKQPVDIALCDIEMPGGSGLELIQWMNDQKLDTVKVIISAHNEFEFAQQAVELHCYSYLLKPVTPDRMSDLLNKTVKQTDRVRPCATVYVFPYHFFWSSSLKDQPKEKNEIRSSGNGAVKHLPLKCSSGACISSGRRSSYACRS